MTKRKRTPSPSPLPRAQVPFQIPASLQRLSMISRSLVHQSDQILGANQDEQNARKTVQVQAHHNAPPVIAATSTGTTATDGQDQGFRAFAPRKQPSFPDAQTWVEPAPRASQVPDATGFMPPTQPSFPKGQTWPHLQPRKVVPWPQPQPQQTSEPVSGPTWLPSTIPVEAAPASSEAPPKKGETLCLETQPHRIAALIAQKRAANEANRKREAWTRQAAAHRMSSRAPDEQLRSELNSTLEQSFDDQSSKTGTGERQTQKHQDKFVTPTTAITFDPIPSSAAAQVDKRTAAQRKKTSIPPVKSVKESLSRDRDSLLTSIDSPSPSSAEPRQPHQHSSFMAQPSAPVFTPSANAPENTLIQSNGAKAKSKLRPTDTTVAHQSPQSNHSTPVTAGYYRFNPRYWQTSKANQQPQQSQAKDWPGSQDVPPKLPSNTVFRNLTQDKFGKFGVGGKLKEAISQQSGAATT